MLMIVWIFTPPIKVFTPHAIGGGGRKPMLLYFIDEVVVLSIINWIY